jgi:carbon storage regulator
VLVTRRRTGESLQIGEDIEIAILEITPGRVLLGVTAPRQVPIVRSEALLVETQNVAASNPPERVASAIVERARSFQLRRPVDASEIKAHGASGDMESKVTVLRPE